ncbi:LysR family transcriptional regulator [Marinomonas spartinae]|uniref:LysR family transcriptional regulator n=1 Tax=Marinomonas spartinae TaxID=1792290 RepID=UPI0018F111B7|nr:LysR family transcriptional regulator [Marinomonas spartinae]MBJ7557008.1 LysR family transcriptional regulator [Marinomonas spartinae]
MQIDDLNVVLKVAQLRSIAAAATHLDMQAATASAAVKRVEAQLGVELFVRTTRQLRLSSAGERYLPQCAAAIAMLDQAQQSIYEDWNEISGEIRIAVSSDLGRHLALPWIDEFMLQHPKVTIRAHLSDSNIDFYRDALDMALRYGPPSDSNLYGFKICNVPRFIVASPEYLECHGEPKHPDELADHLGLFYQLQEILNDTWRLKDEEQVYKVKPKSSRAANDGDMVRRWCVAGHGVAMKSGLDLAYDLLEERLVPILQDYTLDQGELWLVSPSRQSITPIVRLLRDLFREKTHQLLSQMVAKGLIQASVLEE